MLIPNSRSTAPLYRTRAVDSTDKQIGITPRAIDMVKNMFCNKQISEIAWDQESCIILPNSHSKFLYRIYIYTTVLT